MKDSPRINDLIEETYRSLMIFLRYLGVPSSETEDIMQEVYLKAYKAFHRYDSSRSFKSWLFSIAKNTYIDWTRKQKTKQKFLQQSVRATFRESFERQSNSKMDIEKILQELSEEEQILIELRFFQGMPFKEISELVGLTAGAVKMRVLRILTKLKSNYGRCENEQQL